MQLPVSRPHTFSSDFLELATNNYKCSSFVGQLGSALKEQLASADINITGNKASLILYLSIHQSKKSYLPTPLAEKEAKERAFNEVLTLMVVESMPKEKWLSGCYEASARELELLLRPAFDKAKESVPADKRDIMFRKVLEDVKEKAAQISAKLSAANHGRLGRFLRSCPDMSAIAEVALQQDEDQKLAVLEKGTDTNLRGKQGEQAACRWVWKHFEQKYADKGYRVYPAKDAAHTETLKLVSSSSSRAKAELDCCILRPRDEEPGTFELVALFESKFASGDDISGLVSRDAERIRKLFETLSKERTVWGIDGAGSEEKITIVPNALDKAEIHYLFFSDLQGVRSEASCGLFLAASLGALAICPARRVLDGERLHDKNKFLGLRVLEKLKALVAEFVTIDDEKAQGLASIRLTDVSPRYGVNIAEMFGSEDDEAFSRSFRNEVEGVFRIEDLLEKPDDMI